MSGDLIRRGAVSLHKSPGDCPRVKSGEWRTCLGHVPQPQKKKRRRVDVSFRLEEARANLTAIEDVLELVRQNGWVESGDREADWVKHLQRCAVKLTRGIIYVSEQNPTRRVS